jgi:hypothetical protein
LTFDRAEPERRGDGSTHIPGHDPLRPRQRWTLAALSIKRVIRLSCKRNIEMTLPLAAGHDREARE